MTSSFLPCSPMSTILVTKQAQSLMLGTGTLTWVVYCFLLCNTALNLRMNTSGPAVTRSSDRSTQSSTRFMRKCCLMLVLENRNDPLVDTEKENKLLHLESITYGIYCLPLYTSHKSVYFRPIRQQSEDQNTVWSKIAMIFFKN